MNSLHALIAAVSLTPLEWGLVLLALTVLAMLFINLAVDLLCEGCYLARRAYRTWRVRRDIRMEDRRHADPFRLSRETASELHRLATRAAVTDTRAARSLGAAVLGDAAAVSGDAASGRAEGATVTERGRGPLPRPSLRLVCDRDSEYGITTSLVSPAPEKRVIEPWLAGRDLV